MKHSLNKAIKLHKKHMEKPASATMSSQKEMMNLMKAHVKEMKRGGLIRRG